jgi:lipid-A-disaccharide synthase
MIKKYVDTMIVILPFEEEFYKKWDYKVYYVGHPLVEVVEEFKSVNGQRSTFNNGAEKNVIAILPGSRKQEIKAKLPVMLKVADLFTGYKFILAKAPGVEDEFYSSFLSSNPDVETVSNKTYSILSVAKAAMVTSGTATLETALFEVPQVVCYRSGWISYQIAMRLIKLKFISLVNLIMNKEVVKELIQNDLTVENLKHELDELLNNNEKIDQVKKDYRELRNILSAGGNASENAAKIIYRL